MSAAKKRCEGSEWRRVANLNTISYECQLWACKQMIIIMIIMLLTISIVIVNIIIIIVMVIIIML